MTGFGNKGWRYPLGLSRERAELFGKPHVGALYTASGRYRRTAERCAVCGAPATNCHHVARRSWAGRMPLVTPNGTWELRSPLMALCGSGTLGCHGRMHDGTLVVRWEWHRPSYERMWWDGELLALHCPHSPALYRYGFWETEDARTHSVLRIKGDMR